MRPSKPKPEPLVLQEFLPYRLSIASETVSSLFATRYRQRFGLTIPEWRVVAVVGQHGTCSTQEVIERTSMDRVRVSRAVLSLADKGLLDQRPDARDQRARLLHLSEDGRRTYDEIVPLARDLQRALAAALTAAESRQLELLLDKISLRSRAMLAINDEAS